MLHCTLLFGFYEIQQILEAVGMSPTGAVLLTFNFGADQCERDG